MRALCALIRRNFIAARCAALLAPGAFLFDGDIGVIDFSVALAAEEIAIIAAIPAMFIRELDLMFSPVKNQNNLSRCFGLRPLAKPLLAYPCGAGSSSLAANARATPVAPSPFPCCCSWAWPQPGLSRRMCVDC